MMATHLDDWNGKTVAYIESIGKVKVLLNPLNNLVQTGIFPWPAPEIIQKLSESTHKSSFTQSHLSSLTGHYCDLQSLNSEDAITWSVFGTLMYHPKENQKAFVSHLLEMAGVREAVCENTHVWLWRRVPHPDTAGSGGPELDFGILTDNTLVFGESKWNSGIAKNQGKKGDKNQIQLRVEFLKKYARKLYPHIQNRRVLLITREQDDGFNTKSDDGLAVNNLVWKDVCNIGSHPLSDEVGRYYEWKTTVSLKEGLK